MITFDEVCKMIELQDAKEELQELQELQKEANALMSLAMQTNNKDFLKWLEQFGEVPEDLKQKILNAQELTEDEMFEAYCKTGVKND